MQSVTGLEAQHASYIAKRTLIEVGVFIALLVIALVFGRSYLQSHEDDVAERVTKAAAIKSNILWADDRRTLSAYAYAHTANLQMREYHSETIPKMDAALISAKILAPATNYARFDGQTRTANDILVSLEQESFDLLTQGRRADATAIYSSPYYLDAKKSLLNGTNQFMVEVDQDLEIARTTANATRFGALTIITLLSLFGFWMIWKRLNYALTTSETAFLTTLADTEASKQAAMFAARHDALSGLPNRVLLAEYLDQKLALAKSSELALLYVDLDGFKSVNDTYDHETGDKLLRAVSQGLILIAADQGLVARMGGDEFAILIAGDKAGLRAEKVAADIHIFMASPFDIEGRIANVGASIGIAERGNELIDSGELMRRADVAMYDAKSKGRNQWRHFDNALDAQCREDIAIATELRSLVVRGEFDVAYQPIVDSRSGTIVSVEVLARWPQSSSNHYTPDRFIRVAEEHGVIKGLGALIMRIACRDMTKVKDVRLAVNVSPLQLNDDHYIAGLQQIVEETGFDIKRLEIELTENVLIRNPERAKQMIVALRALGITVALDDFGTGYASIGYLRDFEFDKVKLDRSLTHAVLNDGPAQKVVQGTVLIANGLKAEIIAEGVETEAESKLMSLLGCDQLQGFYFGRPQTFIDFDQLLATNATTGSLKKAQIG